ncbi:MAG: exodeoxyribonuclease VII large subunit [Methanomicrobium sp.]|nr:exodeoxyribonuclease VII large subunit [Methanomicrobium sp.]
MGTDEEKDSVKTVYELSSEICRLLDDDSLKGIWVEGEITNFHRHASGHLYFSLIEIRNSRTYLINCAVWKSSARELDYNPKDGAKVKVYGSVEVYEPYGKYQFIARDIIPCGQGDKHILVQKWKDELSELGIFDISRKKALPKYPVRIGVVTAPGGAARRDIENVIARRYPVEIILSPASVQGDSAHTEIAAAIKKIDGMVDVIIVGRGGGSFEDLFEFNHPDVVMAVSECSTPVVSAVGHEIDFTLCDFAADVRAPTPSAAAEIVVPDIRELNQELRHYKRSLFTALENRIATEEKIVENLRLHLNPGKIQRLIYNQFERADDFAGRLHNGISRRIEREKMFINAVNSKLELLNPSMPLEKGFCMIKSADVIIKSAADLKKGQTIKLYMKDGAADSEIKEVYYGRKL